MENNNFNIFKSKVVIILSKVLDNDSYEIDLQDYEENGKSYIPVFTSIDKYNESTKGVDLGKKRIQVDGIFLLSILNGNENIRINPNLKDETYFNASELILHFKDEIEKLKNI